jgi:hypothetical protein
MIRENDANFSIWNSFARYRPVRIYERGHAYVAFGLGRLKKCMTWRARKLGLIHAAADLLSNNPWQTRTLVEETRCPEFVPGWTG